MRETCLHNTWSFVPIFFENLQGINEMNTLESFFFFWGGGGGGGDDESSRWGHSPRMRGGSGEDSLPNYFRWEFILFIKTHFYRGHSLNISWMSTHPLYLYFLFSRWRHEMEICSAFLALCAGNSQVTGELPSQRPMTQSFDVFFDLRLTKRLSKQSRRRWFETTSCSLWRHCNVVPNSDPVIRAAVGSFGVQRVTLVQVWIGETGQIGGFRALWKEWPQSWHTALPWLPFLEINYILYSAAV